MTGSQGKNITLPECPGQVNFDCGHIYFLLYRSSGHVLSSLSSVLKVSPTTYTCILLVLLGNRKVWASNFGNGAGNFLGHPSIGQVMFQVMFLPWVQLYIGMYVVLPEIHGLSRQVSLTATVAEALTIVLSTHTH